MRAKHAKDIRKGIVAYKQWVDLCNLLAGSDSLTGREAIAMALFATTPNPELNPHGHRAYMRLRNRDKYRSMSRNRNTP